MRKLIFSAFSSVVLAATILTATVSVSHAHDGFLSGLFAADADDGGMTVERLNVKVEGASIWSPVWVVKDGGDVVAAYSDSGHSFPAIDGVAVTQVADVGSMYSAKNASAFTGASAILANLADDTDPGPDGIFHTADDIPGDLPAW